jgi:cell division protein FtsW (lipid II flippase)
LRDEPRGLLKMAALSIPLWLIFEAYNLRLANWAYVGLPEGHAERWIGYAWAFATITPAIFMTASLIESFGWFEGDSRPIRLGRAGETILTVFGTVLLVLPLLVPKNIGAHLFGLVWLGFLFLLEPINHRLLLPSFLGDLARGYRGRLYSFFAAGWVCGWLWEFWNYWARAGWIYTFPVFPRAAQQMKFFQMPAPGYLAFPVYALECFTMYVTGAWIFSRKYIAEKKYSE